MVYVARTVYMPAGDELSGRVIHVGGGLVESICMFAGEKPSMTFLSEVYLLKSRLQTTVYDIVKETYHEGEPLYAFYADRDGTLHLLS